MFYLDLIIRPILLVCVPSEFPPLPLLSRPTGSTTCGRDARSNAREPAHDRETGKDHKKPMARTQRRSIPKDHGERFTSTALMTLNGDRTSIVGATTGCSSRHQGFFGSIDGRSRSIGKETTLKLKASRQRRTDPGAESDQLPALRVSRYRDELREGLRWPVQGATHKEPGREQPARENHQQ